MFYIRLSDLRKTKNKDGAVDRNVDYQFEFPRQCIVRKNALSLTQAPMLGTRKTVHWISMKSRLARVSKETLNFKTDHFELIVAAVIWPKYYRYGVKHYPINQSIDK